MVTCKSSIRIAVCVFLAATQVGCELFEPPTPKTQAKAGISKSSAPVIGGPQVWTKQSIAGVSFEAPREFAFTRDAADPTDSTRPAAIQDVESYTGSLKSPHSEHLLVVNIAKMRGPSHLAVNMEPAMRQVVRNTAKKLGDPAPNEVITAAQFGAANGFISSYAFQNPDGRLHFYESVNAASGDSMWVILAASEDPKMRDTAKAIIASISIQP